jgi:hypothetical protein
MLQEYLGLKFRFLESFLRNIAFSGVSLWEFCKVTLNAVAQALVVYSACADDYYIARVVILIMNSFYLDIIGEKFLF